MMIPPRNTPQKSGNRSRFEILAKMVSIASTGPLKTHIMYRANLSHRQLEKYLRFLEEKGLIVQAVDMDGNRIYQVSEKGREFLKDYERLSNHVIAIP